MKILKAIKYWKHWQYNKKWIKYIKRGENTFCLFEALKQKFVPCVYLETIRDIYCKIENKRMIAVNMIKVKEFEWKKNVLAFLNIEKSSERML